CTEGGMDRDFRIIGEAFALAGAPEAFEAYHYPMYADPASRVQLEEMPNGVDRDEFFRLANVDPPHHGYKINLIAPWLKQFAEQGK
ncbi:MAG: alpha/beta hydrolase family protein, partial [Muribaculaceae bacterium]|nr:alpha/beta hydrolase family protein [Muribaculaceae bacterium]